MLVDSGGFNLPFAGRVRRRSRARILYFIAPQVWAWRPGRIRRLAARADRIVVCLPFERAFYAAQGVSVEDFGHPLVDAFARARAADASAASPAVRRAQRRRALGLPLDSPVLGLFPGSRAGELARHLPVQLAAFARLRARSPRLAGAIAVVGLAPGFDEAALRRAAPGALEAAGEAIRCVATGDGGLFEALDVALAKPGTITLEAALHGCPMVVVGRVHPLTAWLARRSARVRHVALPNLILEEEIVPERLQAEATPDRIAEALEPLFEGPARARQLEGLERVVARLGPPGAIARTAELVEEMILVPVEGIAGLGPLAHSFAALAAVVAAPLVAAGAVLHPGFRRQLPERLGLARVGGAGEPRIWLHASSVGEAKAACRLLEALEACGHATRATTMTVAGRGIFERDRPAMPASLAPLDHPWCIESALRPALPRLSVLIETELWPSWIAACARHGIPVVVASGRLSDRSFPRYAKVARLIAPTLRRIAAVGARTETDAERFVRLGVPEARVSITGDLKLDPAEQEPALGPALVRALSRGPVVVAGSTHRGEEEALLRALGAAEGQGRPFVLVLAPRQVDRAGEIVRLARARGRRVQLRSRLEDRPLEPGEVLILDSYGDLAGCYATAVIAFVGGTLVPVGGHNVSEPVHLGCPVLYGPHFSNVRKIVQILEADGAGRCVETPEALIGGIVEGVLDPAAGRRRGEAGRRTLERHRGSVERTRRLVLETLARAEGKGAP